MGDINLPNVYSGNLLILVNYQEMNCNAYLNMFTLKVIV